MPTFGQVPGVLEVLYGKTYRKPVFTLWGFRVVDVSSTRYLMDQGERIVFIVKLVFGTVTLWVIMLFDTGIESLDPLRGALSGSL